MQGHIYFRPFLEEFLINLATYYELIIFTAGQREYADVVVRVIEEKINKKIINIVLSREYTEVNSEGYYIKDLSKIGRDLNRTIIVDNTEENFEKQKENGILIHSYEGFDRSMYDGLTGSFIDNDTCLYELSKILIKIAKEAEKIMKKGDCFDIRKLLKKYKKKITEKVSLE